MLDDGPNIYVWVGPKSVKKEQLGVSMNHMKIMNIFNLVQFCSVSKII